jgi:hypothetical protein
MNFYLFIDWNISNHNIKMDLGVYKPFNGYQSVIAIQASFNYCFHRFPDDILSVDTGPFGVFDRSTPVSHVQIT